MSDASPRQGDAPSHVARTVCGRCGATAASVTPSPTTDGDQGQWIHCDGCGRPTWASAPEDFGVLEG